MVYINADDLKPGDHTYGGIVRSVVVTGTRVLIIRWDGHRLYQVKLNRTDTVWKLEER
jgi:hypothetical protein